MKIAVLADVEDRGMWDYGSFGKLEGVELLVSCGDLKSEYLEYLVTLTNIPLIYVRGNHDTIYDKKPPLGCIQIDDRIFEYKGIRFTGLGGSYRYRPGKDMYTEKEMKQRIRKMKWKWKVSDGFDILVTHSPSYGYGDLDDLAHRGFDCFNDLMNRYHPYMMLYGHVHQAYGDRTKTYDHPSGTIVYHATGFDIVEIPDSLKKKNDTFLYRRVVDR